MRSLTIFIMFLINGCVSQQVPITVTKVVTIDPLWTTPCNIVPPPDLNTYRNASLNARNAMWASQYVKQIEEVALCNIRLKKIKDFTDKTKSLSP